MCGERERRDMVPKKQRRGEGLGRREGVCAVGSMMIGVRQQHRGRKEGRRSISLRAQVSNDGREMGNGGGGGKKEATAHDHTTTTGGGGQAKKKKGAGEASLYRVTKK